MEAAAVNDSYSTRVYAIWRMAVHITDLAPNLTDDRIAAVLSSECWMLGCGPMVAMMIWHWLLAPFVSGHRARKKSRISASLKGYATDAAAVRTISRTRGVSLFMLNGTSDDVTAQTKC